MNFFLPRLAEPVFAAMFHTTLHDPDAGPLRDEIATHPARLVATLCSVEGVTPEQNADVQFQGIKTIHALTVHLPDWLAANRPVLEGLIQVGTFFFL